MKFRARRNYLVDIFFMLPVLSLSAGGIYFVYESISLFKYVQYDKLCGGILMSALGLSLLYYITRDAYIEINKSKFITSDIFGNEVRIIDLRDVSGKYFHEQVQSGITIRELALNIKGKITYISLFGFGKSVYQVQRAVKSIKEDEHTKKRYNRRTFASLGWMLLGIFIIVLATVILFTYNRNEDLEDGRDLQVNMGFRDIEICDLSTIKSDDNLMTGLKFSSCSDDKFEFIYKNENEDNYSYEDLYYKLETYNHSVKIRVNEKLFENKFERGKHPMSFQEMHIYFNNISVYEIIVGNQQN